MNLETRERLARISVSLSTAFWPLMEIAARLEKQRTEDEAIDVDAVAVDDEYCRDCEAPEGMNW